MISLFIKCVTTTMANDKEQHLSIRCCSKQEFSLLFTKRWNYTSHGQVLRSDKVIPCPKYLYKFYLPPYIGMRCNLIPTCTKLARAKYKTGALHSQKIRSAQNRSGAPPKFW